MPCVRRVDRPPSRSLVAALLPVRAAAPPVASYASGSATTVPASGSTALVAPGGVAPYGKLCPSCSGQHGLRVVLRAERRPDPVALGGAVLGAGGHPDQRGLDLAAAASAEQPADDAGDGDQVGHGEVLGLAGAGEHVLAGVVVVGDRLVDVGVDAGDVVGHVGVELLAPGALEAQRVHLGLEVRLGVGRVGPDALLQLPVAGGAAGERGDVAAADVPQQVHHPEPVLGAGVPGAEHGAGAGGAGDVRDAGGLVPHDGDVRARRDRCSRPARRGRRTRRRCRSGRSARRSARRSCRPGSRTRRAGRWSARAGCRAPGGRGSPTSVALPFCPGGRMSAHWPRQ